MTTDHNDLTTALHALADHDDTGTPPTAAVLRRGRHAVRTARVVGTSVAGIGVVAAIGAATALGAAGHHPAPDAATGTRHRTAPTTASAAPKSPSAAPTAPFAAPPMQLVSAVRRTASTTFQVASYADWDDRNTKSVDKPNGGPDCTGGSDPSHHRSWMAGPGNMGVYVKVIGDDIYTRRPAGTAGGPRGWEKYDRSDGAPLGSFYCGGLNAATVSGVLADMRKEGPVTLLGRRTKGGEQFDVYTVTSTKPVIGDGSYDTTQAWVGVKSGYVEQTWSWEAPKGAKAAPSVTLYSHFGEPVDVERP